MKKARIILSLVLAMLIVFSLSISPVSAVKYDDELVLSEWLDVVVGEDVLSFKFVPEEDGYYSFSSLSYGDPWARLYDSDYEFIAYSDDLDFDVSFDFCITEYLYANEIYTLEVGAYEVYGELWQEVLIKVDKVAYPVSAEVVYMPYRTELVKDYEWISSDPRGVEIDFTMSDGSIYSWCYYDDWYTVQGIPVLFSTEWDGDECYMEFSCADAVAKIYCETIENPVDHIEYRGHSIVCYKELDGSYEYDYYDKEYFWYDWEMPEFACVDIYYKDGTKEIVSFNSYEMASYGDVAVYDDQMNNHWQEGENAVFVEYLGFVDCIPVSVVESLVESVEITKTPSTLVYDECFYPVFDGIEITVKFKDGTVDVVDLEENYSMYGYDFGHGGVDLEIKSTEDNIINIECCDGGQYYTVSCMGVTCDYYGFEYIDCGWVEDISVEKFVHDGDGMVVEAMYSDGTVQLLELSLLVGGTSSTGGYEGYALTEKGIMKYCIEESYDEFGVLDGYWVDALGCNDFVDVSGVDISGDANADGAVNVKDATAIQKHTAGIIELSAMGKELADVDGSGAVNVKDATAIQKWVAGIDTGFDIG